MGSLERWIRLWVTRVVCFFCLAKTCKNHAIPTLGDVYKEENQRNHVFLSFFLGDLFGVFYGIFLVEGRFVFFQGHVFDRFSMVGS